MPERRDIARRIKDAFRALAYLAKPHFVDPTHIAALCYSPGGGVALRIAMQPHETLTGSGPTPGSSS